MLRSTLFVLLFAFSVSTYADGFSYNSVTLGYGQTEFDDLDIDGDAIGIGGSLALNDSFHAFAGYSMGDLDDDFGNSADFDELSIGFGHHLSLSEQVDLVSEVSYEYVEVSAGGVSVDDNGFGLGLGLRFAATPQIELDAGISYVDFGDGGDDTGFGAGLLYNINDTFTIGVNGGWTDDTSSYSISGRFYFSR